MTTCDLPYYQKVMPKIRMSQITRNQSARLGAMSKENKAEFFNQHLYNDQDEHDVVEAFNNVFSRRINNQTERGRDIGEMNQTFYNAAEKMAKEENIGKDALDMGAEIAASVRKGAPMSSEERALALPAFVRRKENLPLLIEQYTDAFSRNDEEMTARFGAELAKTIAVFSGVMADRNALSVGMNTYKYMYKQIQKNAKIDKLFHNGQC